MIVSTRVAVSTTRVQLVPPHPNPQKVHLLNAGSVVVRVGGPDVTTDAFGLPAIPNDPNVTRTHFRFDLNPNESISAITSSGTATVNVWYQTF
jgi:hypothetical protein